MGNIYKFIQNKILVGLVSLLSFASCNYDNYVIPEVVVPEEVSFYNDIIPIFEARCVSCHTAGNISPNLDANQAYNSLVIFGYVNTTSPLESSIMKKIDGGSMEKHTSSGDKEIILAWIEQGALDN